MGVAYCIKCKAKRNVIDGKLVYYKNGVPVEKGKCEECGTGVNRIYSREEREALKTQQTESPASDVGAEDQI